MNILIVAAHPDDEILGCGGTVARLVSEGHKAHTLVLGEGVTSRDASRDPTGRADEIGVLRAEMKAANKAIGVGRLFVESFPDNRFDSVPLIEIVKKVEEVKNAVRPAMIFTHSGRDLNIDHRITLEAVITATRPVHAETVKSIYAFEVLSSTEWAFQALFRPNVYYDITRTLPIKLAAIKKYGSELKSFPHPRSVRGVETSASYRGMQIGVKYAEAFELVRDMR